MGCLEREIRKESKYWSLYPCLPIVIQHIIFLNEQLYYPYFVGYNEGVHYFRKSRD